MTVEPRILRASAVVHDITVCGLSIIAAHAIVWGGNFWRIVPGMPEKTFAFTIVSAFCLYLMGLNRGVWRYASIPDMAAIVKAATLAVMLFTIGNFLLSRAGAISRVAMILTWVFMIFGLATGRLVYRFLKEGDSLTFLRANPFSKSGYLLYPFSDNTESYVRAMRRLSQEGLYLVGIIDSRPSFQKRNLHGLQVIGTPSDISEIVRQRRDRGVNITELIVTEPQVSGAQMTELLESCNDSGIGISRLPDMMDFAKAGKTAVLTPNPVKLDDLLGRNPIKIDYAAIAGLIHNRVVLVTGGGGSIGSELCRQVASFSPSLLIILDAHEQNLYDIESEFRLSFPHVVIMPLLCNVRDADRVGAIIDSKKPDVVFHAAALKHVPIVEHNPLEGIKTNLNGTAIVARAAVRAGVKAFILISTDKAVNPSNVMGATKRAAELFCQALDLSGTETTFRIVRFGNVLGSAGSVVPLFQKQIAHGGPVTVTDPNVSRYFMTIPEAVNLILEAASHGMSTEEMRGNILVLDMGEPIRIADLARRLIQLAGFRPEKDIQIEYTGLRPGEKMEEELLSGNEDSVVANMGAFMVAQSRQLDLGTIEKWITDVNTACEAENVAEALDILRQIVPSYRPAENGTNGSA